MTNQSHIVPKLYGIALVASLFLMGLGQTFLTLGRDFINAQRPIDWAHWLILLGAVGAVTSIISLKTKGILEKIATTFVGLGAIAFIGMVAIDILLWTIPPDPNVDDVLDEALSSPGVAIPFLWVGPSLFFIGLALKGLTWWKSNTWAAALLIVGTLLCGYGEAISTRIVTVGGFVAMIMGVLGIVFKGKTVK
jgi:hypothetical protein